VIAKRLMLDTSFLIAALEERKPYAVDAMNAALAQANTGQIELLMAATVEAEMKVKDPTYKRPALIEAVAFDSVAADTLATLLASRHIQPPGATKGYWKFDAMTLACAIAGRADAVVTTDGDFESMINSADLAIKAIAPEEIHLEEMGRIFAKKRRDDEKELKLVVESVPGVRKAKHGKPRFEFVGTASDAAETEAGRNPSQSTEERAPRETWQPSCAGAMTAKGGDREPDE